MSSLFRKASLLWTFPKDGEGQRVLVDGRSVFMTRSQAQRYRELKCGDSGLSVLVNEPGSNNRI